MPANNRFVEVILPLSLPGTYTYFVPDEWQGRLRPGQRVLVSFGKRRIYSALVYRIHDREPEAYQPKPILEVLDTEPIVYEWQLAFWDWMASYYLCQPGDVMNAALPAGYKLSSETVILRHPEAVIDPALLDDKEYLIMEALQFQQELRLEDVQAILGQKTVYPILQQLLERNMLVFKEELRPGYRPRLVSYLQLTPDYETRDKLKELFDQLEKAPRQLDILMAFLHLQDDSEYVRKSEVLKTSGSSAGSLKALIRKGVFIEIQQPESRLRTGEAEGGGPSLLTPAQQKALEEIREILKVKRVVLLHGITSSGKTQVYAHMMEEVISRGKQVLYLLPEIALTTQMIERLSLIFGHRVGVYHSRFSNHERVEIWQKVLKREYDVILGARSALFLPFNKLGMIVVDEEHDSSFKQYDPAPRYHARDSAIYLAGQLGVPVILGSATPAVETIYNARSGKFGIVRLNERYGAIRLPKVEVIPLLKFKNAGVISPPLREAVQKALDQKEQVILFRNRRGYAPMLVCNQCGYVPQCKNCDVSLTYHKQFNELHCHYCNARQKPIIICPACGSHDIREQGFGTERVEDELKTLFPEARVARLDYDATRGKHGFEKIIGRFEQREIDILVGTQMVTKGLDFDHVSLVGILNADHLLHYPDFRADERGFQIMLQVSGRSGRKNKQGLVMIQARETSHPVIGWVIGNQLDAFYEHELGERKAFRYPPFTRLIYLHLKHRDRKTVREAARLVYKILRQTLGQRVYEPVPPLIGRVRNQYLLHIMIKLEKNRKILEETRKLIRSLPAVLHQQPHLRGVVIIPDVDPW